MSAQGIRSRILQLDGEAPPSVDDGRPIDRFDIWAEGRFNSLVDQDEDKNHKGQFGVLAYRRRLPGVGRPDARADGEPSTG